MEGIHLVSVRSLVDSAKFVAVLCIPSGDLCDGNASQNMSLVQSLLQLECAKGSCAEEIEATMISQPRTPEAASRPPAPEDSMWSSSSGK